MHDTTQLMARFRSSFPDSSISLSKFAQSYMRGLGWTSGEAVQQRAPSAPYCMRVSRAIQFSPGVSKGPLSHGSLTGAGFGLLGENGDDVTFTWNKSFYA